MYSEIEFQIEVPEKIKEFGCVGSRYIKLKIGR